MKFHEYANLFPMMPESDLMRLAEDIKEKGQSDPVITLDGMILDGRNRYKACEINGITPRCEEYSGDDPLGFVISHNLHRRHLDETQRGVVGAKIADLPNGGAQYSSKNGPPIGGPKKPTRAEVAKMLNVGHGTIDRAKQAIKNGIPELVSMMESGEVTAYAASTVAKMPEAEQRKAVSGGVAGVKEAAKKSHTKSDTTSCSRANSQSDSSGDSTPKKSSTSSTRVASYVPNDAEELWIQAKSRLDNILSSDISREKVLLGVIEYCKNRIESNK